MIAMTKPSLRKLAAGVAIATTIGAGAFALSSVLPAGAQTGPSTSSSSPAPSVPSGPRARAKAALDGLVAKGTIDQSQEDAVISALRGALGNRPGFQGPLAGRVRGALGQVAQVAADKIGISVDDLKTELQSGKSIAEVATEHNVNPDDVKQALVDAATAKIQQAVDNGRITQDRADRIDQRLPSLADKVVNHHKGDTGPGA